MCMAVLIRWLRMKLHKLFKYLLQSYLEQYTKCFTFKKQFFGRYGTGNGLYDMQHSSSLVSFHILSLFSVFHWKINIYFYQNGEASGLYCILVPALFNQVKVSINDNCQWYANKTKGSINIWSRIWSVRGKFLQEVQKHS